MYHMYDGKRDSTIVGQARGFVESVWADESKLKDMRSSASLIVVPGFTSDRIKTHLQYRKPVQIKGSSISEYVDVLKMRDVLKYGKAENEKRELDPKLRYGILAHTLLQHDSIAKDFWVLHTWGVNLESLRTTDAKYVVPKGVFHIERYRELLEIMFSIVKAGANALHKKTNKPVVLRITGLGLGEWLRVATALKKDLEVKEMYKQMLHELARDWLHIRHPDYPTIQTLAPAGKDWRVVEKNHDPFGDYPTRSGTTIIEPYPEGAVVLIVNAWDDGSFIGNGGRKDNSLDGWMVAGGSIGSFSSMALRRLGGVKLGGNAVNASFLHNVFFNPLLLDEKNWVYAKKTTKSKPVKNTGGKPMTTKSKPEKNTGGKSNSKKGIEGETSNQAKKTGEGESNSTHGRVQQSEIDGSRDFAKMETHDGVKPLQPTAYSSPGDEWASIDLSRAQMSKKAHDKYLQDIFAMYHMNTGKRNSTIVGQARRFVESVWADASELEHMRSSASLIVAATPGFTPDQIKTHLWYRKPVQIKGSSIPDYVDVAKMRAVLDYGEAENAKRDLDPKLRYGILAHTPLQHASIAKDFWVLHTWGVNLESKDTTDAQYVVQNGVFDIERYRELLEIMFSIVKAGANALHRKTKKPVVLRMAGLGLGEWINVARDMDEMTAVKEMYKNMLHGLASDWLHIRHPNYPTIQTLAPTGKDWEVVEENHDPFGDYPNRLETTIVKQYPENAVVLIVNAWDDGSFVGNGGREDNSLDGWMVAGGSKGGFYPMALSGIDGVKLGGNAVNASFLHNVFFNTRLLDEKNWVYTVDDKSNPKKNTGGKPISKKKNTVGKSNSKEMIEGETSNQEKKTGEGVSNTTKRSKQADKAPPKERKPRRNPKKNTTEENSDLFWPKLKKNNKKVGKTKEKASKKKKKESDEKDCDDQARKLDVHTHGNRCFIYVNRKSGGQPRRVFLIRETKDPLIKKSRQAIKNLCPSLTLLRENSNGLCYVKINGRRVFLYKSSA